MLIRLFTVTARKAPSLRSTDVRSSLDGIERKCLHKTSRRQEQEIRTSAAAAPTRARKEAVIPHIE